MDSSTSKVNKKKPVSWKTKDGYWLRKPSKELTPRGSHTSGRMASKVRRSNRTRYPPLKFWRGERLQYRFTSSGGIECLGVERQYDVSGTSDLNCSENGQLASLKDGFSVVDADKGMEVYADIIKPFSSLTWVSFPDGNYKIAYAYSLSFEAHGFLMLPAFEQKPGSCLDNLDILFVILSGEVKVTICGTSILLAYPDTFVVPRGNMYCIENSVDSEALLSFVVTDKSLLKGLEFCA